MRRAAKALAKADAEADRRRAERDAAMVAAMLAGATTREVADDAGVSVTIASRIGQRVFGVRPRGRRPFVTEAEAAEFKGQLVDADQALDA